jgi:hypothetical protein
VIERRDLTLKEISPNLGDRRGSWRGWRTSTTLTTFPTLCPIAGWRMRTPSHSRWSKRDLSAKRCIYFRVDGTHVQARLEGPAQCLSVIIGATPESKKEEKRTDRSASALRIRPGMGKSS